MISPAHSEKVISLLQAQEIPNIKIFHYSGCLNFACHDYFKKALYRTINFETSVAEPDDKRGFPNDFRCLIIDLSSLNYIDASGAKTLRSVIEEVQSSGIDVLLSTTECEYQRISRDSLRKMN